MLTGKSVWHVNQNIGCCFSGKEIRGYYNNMTEKVTRMPKLLYGKELPQLEIGNGQKVYFPVAVFQYAFGTYDLYLMNKEESYLQKFLQCAEWAYIQQETTGAWRNFFYIYPEHPFSAMAQGEGASLLIRAYVQTGEARYLEAAHKAIDYMLKPLEEGGTTDYSNGNVVLREYTQFPMVMNGFIFAWWGLYDYVLITNDKGRYKDLLEKSCDTLISFLPQFKLSYWSRYDLSGRISSPFYHNLHVAQMQAMFSLTGNEVFHEYAMCWGKQQQNKLNKSLALLIKAIQKLKE